MPSAVFLLNGAKTNNLKKIKPLSSRKKRFFPLSNETGYVAAVENYFRRINQETPELSVKEVFIDGLKLWKVKVMAHCRGDELVFENVSSAKKPARRQCYRQLHEKLNEMIED